MAIGRRRHCRTKSWREELAKRAQELATQRAKRTDVEQLALVASRRGKSLREVTRLTFKIAEAARREEAVANAKQAKKVSKKMNTKKK